MLLVATAIFLYYTAWTLLMVCFYLLLQLRFNHILTEAALC